VTSVAEERSPVMKGSELSEEQIIEMRDEPTKLDPVLLKAVR
jgi:hypothetical protein